MNRQERMEICHLIRYEMEKGIHTYSSCLKCDRNMSRGGHCWRCLLNELEEAKSSPKTCANNGEKNG